MAMGYIGNTKAGLSRFRARRNWRRALKAVTKTRYQRKQSKIVTRGAMVRYVNKDREKKYYLLDSSGTELDSSYTDMPICLTPVPQATDVQDDSHRDGDMITPVRLHFRWGLLQSTSSTAPANVRVIMYRYKLISNADPHPVPGDILQEPASYPLTTCPQHDNKGTYDILYDRVHVIPGYTVGTNCRTYYPGKTIYLSKKQMNANIKFAAGGTHGRNHIFVQAYSSTASNKVKLLYSSNFEFTDS